MATNPAAQVLGSAPGVKLSFISVMRELAVCHHPGEDSIPWSRVSRIRDLVSSIEYLVGTIASRRGEAFQSCMSLQQCAVLSRMMVSACLTAAPRSSWRNLGGLPSPLFWFESPPPNQDYSGKCVCVCLLMMYGLGLPPNCRVYCEAFYSGSDGVIRQFL